MNDVSAESAASSDRFFSLAAVWAGVPRRHALRQQSDALIMAADIGNRPGTFDNFARVGLRRIDR